MERVWESMDEQFIRAGRTSQTTTSSHLRASGLTRCGLGARLSSRGNSNA